MKNFITTLIITILTVTATFATTTPETELVSNDEITVTTDVSEFFTVAAFNQESETLEFTTVNEISVIQIYDNEGNLEFQLPVMSNMVKINKNLLADGQQKLGFVMDGVNAVHFTQVNVK